MVPSGRIHNVLEIIAPNDVLVETEEKAAGLSADMMNSSVESAPRTMPARRRRWQTLCLVLATCSFLAIGIGFDVSRRFMAIYTESVRLNREWSNRLESYSELGELAAAINAPCSDVFDTHDDAVESAKLDKAVAQFGEKMRELREETSSRVPPIESRAIFQQMDAVQATVDLITGDARLIFACFRDDQPDEAGSSAQLRPRPSAVVRARYSKGRVGGPIGAGGFDTRDRNCTGSGTDGSAHRDCLLWKQVV